MIISISTQNEFVPEWNHNKTSDEPIVVQHLAPTLALYNKLIPKPVVEMRLDKDMNGDGGVTQVTIDNTKLVREMVTNIKNLTLDIDGKPVKILTGAELFGPNIPAVLAGLVDEIGSHLQTILTKRTIDSKN
jgi:hypothetical protein